MSIQLTRFSPGVLTDAQLNALVDAITAKFNSQISTNDILWPLKAGGNLDMQQFELLHVAKFWNTYNLAERATTTSFQNLLDTVDALGGGVVILPANTTETVGTAGVTVGANTIIMGQGRTSVFATVGTDGSSHPVFRNKANGNTGIRFINCKIDQSGAASGTYNLVEMTRTGNVQFGDVWVNATRGHGVALLTDSTGSSCTSTKFFRSQFDVSATGGKAGIFMSDVDSVSIDQHCEFNVTGVGAMGIQYTANGGGSNGEKVHISGNVFQHATGTAQYSIKIAGPTTTKMKGLKIIGNHIDGDGTAGGLVNCLDVRDITLSDINSNEIRGVNLTATPVVHIGGTSTKFSFDDNTIDELTGTPYGVIIGGTARSGSVEDCTDFSCCDNRVTTGSHTAFAWVASAATAMNATIADNKGSAGALEAVFEIWNLGAEPTTKVSNSVITGNVSSGAATVGWANYTDMGATRGGRLGNANNTFIAYRNNSAVAVKIGNNAGDDFRETDVATRKCLTDNPTTPGPLGFNLN